MSRQKLSAVIMTLNEEALLQRCLDSLKFADQVLVVDSGSSDGTLDIARRNGADIVFQPWLGWSQQRNFSGRTAKFDWVLMLDADEVVTDKLRLSILEALGRDPSPRDAFAMDRRAEFMGALLPNMKRRSKLMGFCRLYNRLYSAYDETQSVHEEVLVPGNCHLLDGYLLHWRQVDIAALITQNNRYTTLEADLFDSRGVRPSIHRLIFRPIARFGWCYFVCGAYKLGMRGFLYSVLKAMFDFMTDAKLWELHQSPVEPAQHVARHLPAAMTDPQKKEFDLAS